MRADAMLAEFHARGGRVRWIETTDAACEATFSHREYNPDGITLRMTLKQFTDNGVAMTWDDKKRQMVLKDNWRNYPAAMLRARITSAGVRIIDPGAIAGTYTPEEVHDFAPGDLEALEATFPDAGQPTAWAGAGHPVLPALPAKVDNKSGHGSGKYASPKIVDAYKAMLTEFVDGENARWADEWTRDGGLVEGIRDVLSTFAVTGHMLKWALRTLDPATGEPMLAHPGFTWDPDTGKPTEKVSSEQATKFVALVWQRHTDAFNAEVDEYAKEVTQAARDAWHEKYGPKDAPAAEDASQEPPGGETEGTWEPGRE